MIHPPGANWNLMCLREMNGSWICRSQWEDRPTKATSFISTARCPT